jgi:hypothetical protein
MRQDAGDPPSSRSGSLLPLTLLVAFLVGTGRWGSYLGIPSRNLFVTDVGLLMTATWWVGRHRDVFVPARLRPLLPVLVLTAWAAARFLTGGHFDTTAVRDLAPYVYLMAAVFACWAVPSSPRTRIVLELSMVIHLAWIWVSLRATDWVAGLPFLGGKVRVLELRHDFDGTIVAVLVCMAILRAAQRDLPRSGRVAAAVVAVVGCYTILQLGTRAGLLALVVLLGLVGLSRAGGLRRVGRRRLLAAAALVLVAGGVILPRTYLVHRLTESSTRLDSGSGTAIARQEAWSLVIKDAATDPARLVIGSGFGPDFLDRSGAAVWFEGSVEKGVRAPHNYVLNTLARLGLVGVALMAWVVAAVGRAVVRQRRRETGTAHDGFEELLVLLVSALAVASLLGVILESPFGAVPFWWAAGLLLVGDGPQSDLRGDYRDLHPFSGPT